MFGLQATLANLKHALPKVNSAVGVRARGRDEQNEDFGKPPRVEVATAVERFIVANGVKGSRDPRLLSSFASQSDTVCASCSQNSAFDL